MKENALLAIMRALPKVPYGPLAQSVEQLAFNQLVDGSIPSRPTRTTS